MIMGLWLLVGLVAAIGAVLVFRALARRSVFRGRVAVTLTEVHASVKDQVSFEVFSEVWTEMGKAYGVDPRLIRPTDTFADLSKADSWALGKADDHLAKWLDSRGLGRPPQLRTVLDLATWVRGATRGTTSE
jgi:hypothetical protein